ncbi:MAG: histidine kinase [Betaproteobacteria bacterium]|nr:histidine kinase [Betaproteobacteria bacterium]
MNATHDAAQIRALELEVRKQNEHFHPLELIPYFRRWPHSDLRDLLYTLIWSCLIGFAFTAIALMFGTRPSWRLVQEMLLFSICIGYNIHMLFYIASRAGCERWVNARGKLVLTAYYTVIPSAGVVLGVMLASLVMGRDVSRMLGSPSWMLVVAVNAMIISLIIGVIYFWREKSLVADMRIAAERERHAQAERAATLANLRALQAQIEPHFLFNTLANVVGLIHPQPDTAKLMLERFIAYLRASLAASREESTTLAAEFELMKNFLGILQIRMGDRLAVETELPAALSAFSLPPMLLQPLVENAIKHGLEPKIDGGTLTLTARETEGEVEIVVADTGAGFSGATSNGIGLKNVRERIEKIFDGRGHLRIEENAPCGTRVVITLPRN